MTPILHYAYSVRLPINAETGQSGIGTGSGSGRYGSVESWREAIKTPPPGIYLHVCSISIYRCGNRGT